ncbi:MAG TPA: rRNA maturation RNase YbeY, partial [Alphaproteobacteria bacterium]|nr:rRNA maturation RNase YbeY [Alphaproteobacteria bacterium]
MPKSNSKSHVDTLFDSPLWGRARLGAKSLVPELIEMAWTNVPNRPRGFVPEVSVTLTDDASIRILNREHRGKDKPTNVLSFPDWESLGDIPAGIGEAPVGDIIVAFETVKREALEQGKPFKAHFSHMIVHGFLHLLG